MHELAAIFVAQSISVIGASATPIMVDDTGMCGGCRVTIGDKVKFACVDGPEFYGHMVDYDELMLRFQAYTEEERRSHEEHCRLTGVKAA